MSKKIIFSSSFLFVLKIAGENLAFLRKICYTIAMNIYAISDLHLSANAPKPMNVFGGNWEGHFEKIKSDWREKVTDEDAVLTGVETRSSSPVRVKRGEDLQSNLRGLYPCGEGAGYAGGIMSAAVDGLRCAIALAARYGG